MGVGLYSVKNIYGNSNKNNQQTAHGLSMVFEPHAASGESRRETTGMKLEVLRAKINTRLGVWNVRTMYETAYGDVVFRRVCN